MAKRKNVLPNNNVLACFTVKHLPFGQAFTQMKTDATVRREYGERSYIVSTPNGQVRRNKRHLNSLPKDLATEVPQSSPQPGMKAVVVAPVPSDQENVTTRSGRVVRPPQRLVAE